MGDFLVDMRRCGVALYDYGWLNGTECLPWRVISVRGSVTWQLSSLLQALPPHWAGVSDTGWSEGGRAGGSALRI